MYINDVNISLTWNHTEMLSTNAARSVQWMDSRPYLKSKAFAQDFKRPFRSECWGNSSGTWSENILEKGVGILSQGLKSKVLHSLATVTQPNWKLLKPPYFHDPGHNVKVMTYCNMMARHYCVANLCGKWVSELSRYWTLQRLKCKRFQERCEGARRKS